MKKKYLFFVGIDISARTLDVVYGYNFEQCKHQQFLNNAKGINELITLITRTHAKQEEVLICCEHTGVYMDKLAYTSSINFYRPLGCTSTINESLQH